MIDGQDQEGFLERIEKDCPQFNAAQYRVEHCAEDEHMVLALGIEHSRKALDAQAAATEMTNEMFRRNAETLIQVAIDAAAASEKAIVDIETMRKVNADIITSINEVVKIHEDGSRHRMEAQAELARLESELKQALLEAGSRR